MKLPTILSRLALALATGAATSAAADPTAIVTAKVDHYANTRAFKGAVVVVVDHGSYYWYNYGWRSNTDGISIGTPIAVASTTKEFTATSLALQDRFSSIPKETELGSLITITAGSPPKHATLADLVSYYAGLPRDLPTAPTTRAGLFHTLSVCSTYGDPCVAPETASVYSNYGFEVLGNVLAELNGYAAWTDLNHAQITGPLGMTKTCTRGDGCHPSFATSHAHPFDFAGNEVALPDYNDITAPAGGLWTTAQDMAIWLHYQLGQIPSSTTAIANLNAVLPALRTKLPSGSGYSWQFQNLTFSDGVASKIRYKLGRYQGFNSYTAIADSRQTAVFVFVNRDGSDPAVEDPSDVLRDELGEKILAMFP